MLRIGTVGLSKKGDNLEHNDMLIANYMNDVIGD